MSRLVVWIPTVAGVYAFAGGLLSLLGWTLDLPQLADWDGDGIAMQPNAGLAAIMTGLALLLRVFGRRTAAVCLGGIVIGLGAATLFEHVTDVNLGIDQLLLFDRVWGMRGTVAPGRMGIPAATSWMVAGIALVLLRRTKNTHPALPAIGLVIATICGLSIAGYLFGADRLYALPKLTAIALQTATILFAVGVGLVAIAHDRQPMRILIEDSSAGALARRALPVILILPIVIGFVCVQGQNAGLYDASMTSALLVLLLVVSSCTVVWWGVTAVRAREQSLLRSEERFSRFMEHLPGLAWIKDSAGRYLYVNESAEKVFQTPREQLYGKTDDDIFPRATAVQFRQHDQAALATGKGVQVIETLKHDDGVIHHSIVSKFPISVQDQQSTLVGGIAVDITERKRAEETVQALLRISAKLNSTLDVDGLLEILVEEAIQVVGAESGVSGLLTPQGMVCRKYFQKGQELPLEYCWPPMHGLPGWLIVHQTPYLTNDAKADGQIVPELCEQFGVWSALSTPIVTATGDVIGFFEIHNKTNGTGFTQADQDLLIAVSQAAAIAVQNALAYRSLQQAEESLKESDRRKDEFLAVLAHELRNPLAPIRNGLEIIKHANGRDAVLIDAQRAMDRQLTHLVRLVDDLLDLSRISRDKLELRKQRVELADVLRQAVETIQPLANAEDQSIEIKLPQRAIYLEADPIRLAQVFGNLLNNACKFSGPGGRIFVAARSEANEAIISVTDNGIGIPPEKLGQIFEMFTQAHQSFERSHRGLGIGLTLVRRLVEMHGGTVVAHSQGENQGSEFVVRLPLVHVEPTGSSIDGAAAPAQRTHRCRILVVDDNCDAAMTLGMLMKLNGHEAALAHDGEEACQVAESYRPDVILLDIGLPKMNGYDVCRAIRRKSWASHVAIIALTGWGQDSDRRQSLAAGFNSHLVKPVDHQALLTLLANVHSE